MDTLSHGLWGAALFGQDSGRDFKLAVLTGMAPDLLSFGPFFATHLPQIIERWGHHGRMEPPDPRIIPHYVYSAYNVTHSLVIWSVVFMTLRRWHRHAAWIWLAWGFHVLCDIPTHSTRFFPTPFLWPFRTPFVNGTPWPRSSFMLANYAAILVVFLAVHWRKKHRAEFAK